MPASELRGSACDTMDSLLLLGNGRSYRHKAGFLKLPLSHWAQRITNEQLVDSLRFAVV